MIPYQPKWKGRKKIRHLVAALTIGAATISLHYIYKKIDTPTENGWKRETAFVRSTERHSNPPEVLSVIAFLLNGTTTWTVPVDFGSLVSVQCIGAGSSGNSTSFAAQKAAGGGGADAKITTTSTALTSGVTIINVGIGLGGASVTNNTTSTAGGDTWWNATSLANAVTLGSAIACAAQAGQASTSGVAGLGGTAANSVGTTKFSGGNGNAAVTATGGGGAGGPSGAGSNGTATNGGNADNGTVLGPTVTADGNSGTEFDGTHGCGTGALTLTATVGNTGGLYGGGGSCGNGTTSASGAGANGLLIITYTTAPVFTLPDTNFISSRRYKVVCY